MANGSSTLARIQGRGLAETTTKDVEQEGAQLATTPMIAGMTRGPDSAKMAGTQPSKVNALRVAMQDVGSRRLGAIREMAKEDLAADQRVQGVRQKASVLGRLDESMAVYINQQLKAQFAASLLPSGANLKSTVYEGNTTLRADLLTAINKIMNTPAAVTDADIKIVNDALASPSVKAPDTVQLSGDKMSADTNAQLISTYLFTNLTPEQMRESFGKAVVKANEKTTLSSFLNEKDVTDEATGKVLQQGSGNAFAQAQGFNDAKELEQLLLSILPKVKDDNGNLVSANLSKMRLGDVTAAIQQWRQEEFKDVTQYQETLVDPTASPAQRQLALENLRRLGKVGVLALDQKVGDLDAQMQDGDTVTIDNQSFEISEFFEKPEALAQLKGWLDKPDTAPKSLQEWITANRDAIQNKIKDLAPDLQTLADKVSTNQKNLEIDKTWAPNPDLLKEFFGNIFEPSLDDRYTAATKETKEKIEMLKDKNTGSIIAQLMNSLSSRSIFLGGTGLSGTDVFNKLTKADLNAIVQGGVPRFMDNLVKRSQVAQFTAPTTSFTEATLPTEVRNIFDKLGMRDAGILISRVVNRTDLKQFLNILPEKSELRNYITAEGGFNFEQIKNSLKTFSSSSFSALADNSTRNTLIDEISKFTDAVRKVPAPVPETVDFIKYFDLGKNPDNFKWDEMDLDTKRERNIFFNEVGVHPDYRIAQEQKNIDNYKRLMQEELNKLTAQGWVISNLGDGQQGGDNIWLENPNLKDSRGRSATVDYDPTNQFGLQAWSKFKNYLNSARERQNQIRQEYTQREQRYTTNLKKYVETKQKKVEEDFKPKKKLYDDFMQIWG